MTRPIIAVVLAVLFLSTGRGDVPFATSADAASAAVLEIRSNEAAAGAVVPSVTVQAESVALFQNTTLEDFDFFLDEGGKKKDVFSLGPDGILRVTGKPFGWIGTKKEYKNFTLTLDYRWAEDSEPSNSGLFVRLNGNSAVYLPRAIEVQLQHTLAGDLLGFGGMGIAGEKERYLENLNHRTGELRSVKKFQRADVPSLEKKPGEWNTLHVQCYEGLIVVRLNDRIVNWAHGVEALPGKIAFQSEGGPVDSSQTLATWSFKLSFAGGVEQSLSLGSTVATLLFLVAFVFGLLYIRTQRTEVNS